MEVRNTVVREDGKVIDHPRDALHLRPDEPGRRIPVAMSDLQEQANLADVLRDYNAVRQCVDKGSICHAPESSMYFGRDGLVSACCYSRMAPLGRYPEQSIESIWTGAQASAMRAALRNNELPAGCNLCADELYAGNYSGLLASGFDALARPLPASGPIAQLKALVQPGKAKRYPVQLEFELSNTCNLECAMCSGFWSSTIRAKRENLPPLPQFYDSAFVEQLVPFLPHLKRAKFLGGEPFLIDIYYEIWERLIELNPNCDVSITTNGTVYTSKVKRILEKLNCRITVSLDSVNSTTYGLIRKNAKLERTLNHLEAFCEINRLKKKGLTIAVCPLISNCREIPEIVSFRQRARHSRFLQHSRVSRGPFDQDLTPSRARRPFAPLPNLNSRAAKRHRNRQSCRP